MGSTLQPNHAETIPSVILMEMGGMYHGDMMDVDGVVAEVGKFFPQVVMFNSG